MPDRIVWMFVDLACVALLMLGSVALAAGTQVAAVIGVLACALSGGVWVASLPDRDPPTPLRSNDHEQTYVGPPRLERSPDFGDCRAARDRVNRRIVVGTGQVPPDRLDVDELYLAGLYGPDYPWTDSR